MHGHYYWNMTLLQSGHGKDYLLSIIVETMDLDMQ